METKGYVLLTVRFEREGDQWTAECLELGTATFGDTLEEAEEAITEAIGLHLNALEKYGERERFLREHNIAIYPSLPKKKPPATKVSVPAESLVRRMFRELTPA